MSPEAQWVYHAVAICGGVIVELALLAMQVWAFYRFRHFSFLLLSASTVCGLVYFACYALVYRVENWPILLATGTGFFAVEAVLGAGGACGVGIEA